MTEPSAPLQCLSLTTNSTKFTHTDEPDKKKKEKGKSTHDQWLYGFQNLKIQFSLFSGARF